MFGILITILAITGVVAIATAITAKVKGESLEDAFKDIGNFIQKEIGITPTTEPFFVPDEAVIEKVRESVSAQSLLDRVSTLCVLNTSGNFPVLSVQILPKNDNSLEIAQKTAATIISNVANVCGISVDIVTDTRPYNGAMVIDIGMATTAAQKAALADYRVRKNKALVLDASGDQGDFVDPDLQAVIGGVDEDGNPL